MKIEFCENTGLLYINDVAVTNEMYEHLHTIIDYNNMQFNCSVIINDKINEARVAISKDELLDIDLYLSNNGFEIASANEFIFNLN